MFNNGNEDFAIQRNLPQYLPGQVVLYARKSTCEEKGKARSVKDQLDVCLETAQQYNLPCGPDDIRAEPEGLGGDVWYEGGGHRTWESLQPGAGNTAKHKSRPQLSRIVKDIVAGETKCIVVWALDRLWRSVAICADLLDLFAMHGVMIVDRNGYIPINTPDARASVLSACVAAAHQREMCCVNVPRGQDRKRKAGGLVTNANCLGIRSAGKYTGRVEFRPEEFPLIHRIFRLYLEGENGEGPMSSPEMISRRLTSEAVEWPVDLYHKCSKQRNQHTIGLIYEAQVKKVLTEVKYIGLQRHAKKVWDCPAYRLADGNTIVSADMFQRAQEKLTQNKRIPGAGQELHALTGLMKCGVDGQNMSCHMDKIPRTSGTIDHIPTWRTIKSKAWSWCTDHEYINLDNREVDRYIDDLLAPLLCTEIREQRSEQSQAALRDKRASLCRDLAVWEHKRTVELPQYFDQPGMTPKILGQRAVYIREQVLGLKEQILHIEMQVNDQENIENRLSDLRDAPVAARRDALRACLQWVAVIPSDAPSEIDRLGRPCKPNLAGFLVFLSKWGTLHTAVIERAFVPGNRLRQYVLRPASPDEAIGSVADFPVRGDKFVAGLKRTYDGRRMPYRLEEIAPGWQEAERVAEFDV